MASAVTALDDATLLVNADWIDSDRFDRFMAVLVYVPRERYGSGVRRRIGDFLAASLCLDFANGRPKAGERFLCDHAQEDPLIDSNHARCLFGWFRGVNGRN